MLSGLKILLAEDNPTNQLVASQMLESLGASVTLANDGAEALEILERETFDAALIDIEMPRVSGIELIRRIRAAGDDRAGMPLIALTAYVMREHRLAIEASGADGIIAKPILSIEQFGADVLRFVRKRRPHARKADAPGASSGGAGEDAEIIDREVYDALVSAVGADAMAELLDKVKADLAAARERLERAFEGPSPAAEVRAAAHVLISVGGAIGATRVHDLSRRLHTAAEAATASAGAGSGMPAAGPATAPVATADDLRAEVGGLVREIDRLLEHLAGGGSASG